MKKTTNTHLSFALQVGSELFDKYRILKVLNNTQYGFDYLVVTMDDSNKKTYVIKEFFPNECVIRGDKNQMLLRASLSTEELLDFNFMRNIFEGEAANLLKVSNIKHANIVKLIEVFENKNNTKYLVMSYEEGISLSEYLEKRKEQGKRQLSNEDIYNIIYPLLQGLEDIYKLDIYHLDIKPENIIIKKDGTLTLVGFHASTIFYDERSERYRNIFTSEYASPEQININNISEIDQRSDIYSIGVLLYYLITSTLPPKAETREKSGKNDPYLSLLKQEFSYKYDISLLSAVDKALSISKKNRFKNPSQFKNAIRTIKSVNKQEVKKERKNPLHLLVLIVPLLALFTYFLWEDSPEKLKSKISIENKTHIKPVEKQESTISKSVLDNNVSEHKSVLKKSQDIVPIKEVKTVTIEKKPPPVEVTTDIKIQVHVKLPRSIGKTTTKVNGKEYNDSNIHLEKETFYEISIENPYYQPLSVKRTYDELSEFPVQNFMLVPGKGKIHLDGLPVNTLIKVYEVEKNINKEFNSQISYQNGMYEMLVKSGKKFYLVFENKEYKPYETEIMTLLHGEALTLTYSLEKKEVINVPEEILLPIDENKSTQEINNTIVNKEKIEKIEKKNEEAIEKKNISKEIPKVKSKKKASTKVKTKKTQTYIKKKKISKETPKVKSKKKVSSKVKTKKTQKHNKRNKVLKETTKVSAKKKAITKEKIKKNQKHSTPKESKVSDKSKSASFVWYCNAKSIGSIKVSAKHANKLVAQKIALRKCNKRRSGCKILNCFLLRD